MDSGKAEVRATIEVIRKDGSVDTFDVKGVLIDSQEDEEHGGNTFKCSEERSG